MGIRGQRILPAILLAALSAATGCCRRAVEKEFARDSVRVEVRERVELLRDTVLVRLPGQMERVETRDTVSRLENDCAWSVAEILTGGVLRHALGTREEALRVPVQIAARGVDSIIFRDRVVAREVEVTREVRAPWGWFVWGQLVGFWLLLALLLWRLWRRLRRGWL